MIFEGIVKIPLQKTMRWEDRPITQVDLDFSKVTGKVIMDAEKEVFQGGNITIVRTMSADYCSRIASAISEIPFRVFQKMHSVDFDPIWQTVAAYVGNKNPQEFYDNYISEDNENKDEDEKGGDLGFTKITEKTK